MESPAEGADNQNAILRQARDRAGRVAEDLRRHHETLSQPWPGLSEDARRQGEEALHAAATAASRVLDALDNIPRAERPVGSADDPARPGVPATPASPSTPTDQARS